MQSLSEQQLFGALQALDDYLAAQARLADALKGGLLELAQSKYALGPAALSQAHYPGVMAASAHVTRVNDQQQQQQQSQQQSQQEQQSQVGNSDDGCLFDEFALLTAAAAGGSDARQHKQAAGEEHQRNSGDGQHHGPDPVTWFSALPPAPLKAAQASFRGAVEAAVEAANAGQRLRQHVAHLEQLGGSGDDGAGPLAALLLGEEVSSG